MKIKRDYNRIIKEINNIDNKIMYLIIEAIFSSMELNKTFNDLSKATSHIIASVIMLRPKKIDYVSYLKKVIEKNNHYLLDTFNVTMTIDELEQKFAEKVRKNELDIRTVYFCLLLKFLSENIFHGETLDHIKKKCREYIARMNNAKKLDFNPNLLKAIELSEELKDSKMEKMLNAMTFELEGGDKLIDDRNPAELAEKYLCEYDHENKVYNKLKRGILLFFNIHTDDLFYMKSLAEEVIKLVMFEFDRVKKEKWNLSVIRKKYFEDKEKIERLRHSIKSLKKEKKRLNDRVLKKINKSSQKDLEKKVHDLQKENNYNLSHIEKMEEQIAVLEEEKKLNAELEDNIVIEEKEEKKKTAKPEYMDIVVLGGRWTSNNRKEVLEFLPSNNIEFIDADKTMRNFDRISNADLIFFDTSFNSHSYYHKAKKMGSTFFHINHSNLLEFEKIFEEEEA
ncbi:MAG: hypothetical protein H8E57_00120 [Candidatus Cloacimonetes bacterium]|nr:hypothetical protein [Candidatus Cloacimonadota bacterium]